MSKSNMLIELALADPRYSQDFEDALMMMGCDYNSNFYLCCDLLGDTAEVVVNNLEQDEPQSSMEEPVQTLL